MDGRQCVGLDCPSSCSTHIQLDGKLGRSKGKTSSGRRLASATSYNSVSSKSLVILSNVLPLQSPQTPMAREEACRGARRRQQCSKCRSGKRHGVLMHGDVECQRVGKLHRYICTQMSVPLPGIELRHVCRVRAQWNLLRVFSRVRTTSSRPQFSLTFRTAQDRSFTQTLLMKH